jgi:hypothetical protein
MGCTLAENPNAALLLLSSTKWKRPSASDRDFMNATMLSWVFALISAETSAAHIGDPTLISAKKAKAVISFIIILSK